MEKENQKIWEENSKRRIKELPDFYNENEKTYDDDDDADCYNDD